MALRIIIASEELASAFFPPCTSCLTSVCVSATLSILILIGEEPVIPCCLFVPNWPNIYQGSPSMAPDMNLAQEFRMVNAFVLINFAQHYCFIVARGVDDQYQLVRVSAF